MLDVEQRGQIKIFRCAGKAVQRALRRFIGIDVREPGYQPPHDPSPVIDPGASLVQRDAVLAQPAAIMVEQRLFMTAPVFHLQRSDDEIAIVAPWPPPTRKLPIEPQPFAIGRAIATAQMCITMDQAERRGVRPFFTDTIRNPIVADYFKQLEAGPAKMFAGFVPGSLVEGLAPFTRPTLTGISQNQRAIRQAMSGELA